MTEQTCTIPNCGEKDDNGHAEPRLATHGLICEWHNRKFRDALIQIPDLCAELDVMAPERGAGEQAQRSPKHREPPAPLNLDVVSMRDPRSNHTAGFDGDPDGNDLAPVHGMLASWCLLVSEERSFSLPSDNITSMVVRLLMWADWMVQQDWITEAYREITAALRSLRRVTGWQPPQRIGACYLYDGDEKCGGDLIQSPTSTEVQCKQCREKWTTPRERAILAIALNSSSEYSTSTSEDTASALSG